MPFAVTWDHVHLRSPDPEATAAWLRDILGGEIVRAPGRIDVQSRRRKDLHRAAGGRRRLSTRRRRIRIRASTISGSR